MSDEKLYNQLKKEFPAIAKIVSSFPESLHGRAFDILVGELLGNAPAPHAATSAAAGKSKVHGKEIKGIAHIDDQGKFHLSVRDPKANSANKAARRLAYIAIRAHEELTGEGKVSSKAIVVPTLEAWRCYDGNTRTILANDKGIHREGDLVWLDTPAKDEADKFIKEVLDDKVEGSWKPSASGGKAKKKETKPTKTSGK
jgi:hypothetical protein